MVGETGENSNVWFTQAIRLLESNNIGWAWWPLKKLGGNNPLEIRSNLNYDDLVNYWNGKGKQPKESSMYSGLPERATYALLENNFYHQDVIDAMMRQPFSATAIPYNPNIISHGSLLKTAEYDPGRNGIAYCNTDSADYHISGKPGAGKQGITFRNDGADICKDYSLHESYYASDTKAGEWLQYIVTVREKSVYTLQIEAAADSLAGSISISSDNKLPAKNLTISRTGGLKHWKIGTIKNVAINKGRQALKLHIVKGGSI